MIRLEGLSLVVEAFLRDQGFRVDSEAAGSAQIVGIRGARIVRAADGEVQGLSILPSPTAITDRYDDAIFVCGRKAGGERYADVFQASLQPGRASFALAHYRNRGCPIVQPGQYQYGRGLHNPPSGQSYPALRQRAAIVVVRDYDQDALQEATDRWDYPASGLNIHAGGASESVGRWSEGCQVIRGGRGAGSPWSRFRRLVYEVAAPQSVFHYALVDGEFFGKWFDAGGASRSDAGTRRAVRRLWFGSHGERVAELQERLVKLGHYHAGGVDGEFGVKTHMAVRRWQAAEGKAVTGVV
ncbi:peptidoglycan-binding protein [bacterium]|nr:peptidoglycan-binding protein [bacterium]